MRASAWWPSWAFWTPLRHRSADVGLAGVSRQAVTRIRPILQPTPLKSPAELMNSRHHLHCSSRALIANHLEAGRHVLGSVLKGCAPALER